METVMIADYACATGEGPLWHPMEKRVYWADIPAGRLFRYDPATGQHEMFYEGDLVGGFTIQADGALLLLGDRGSVRIWRDGQVTTVLDSVPGEENSRFNDVIADPEGRVFCGTMSSPDRLGKLYRLDTDGSIRPVIHDVGTSNGMGFTPDRGQMYYTDSGAREIYIYDYDAATGDLTNRRVFVKLSEDDPGVPDGMTVDSEGYVWSARWGGGCLVRYAPDGSEDTRITFPARKVSSVIFGGDGYADMYVTTAGGPNKPEEGAGAGALFRVKAVVPGVPEFFSRVLL